MRCIEEREKILKRQRRLEECPTQHDQESRTVSLSFYDPDLPSSCDNTTFLMKLLLHRGNVFDYQHARRDPDKKKSYSRNLATLLGTLRTEGIEKSESEEPLQSTPFIFYFGKSKTKCKRWKASYDYD